MSQTLTPPPLLSTHTTDMGVLEKNLRFIARRSPHAARAIREAEAPTHVELCAAPDESITGFIESGGVRRQLASQHAPLHEAQVFADAVNIKDKPAILVRGFGVGHHIAALCRRVRQHGVIFVYEPDVSLLRAVLERIDCTAWLGSSCVVFCTDATDTGAMSISVQGVEGLIVSGMEIVDHPASRARLHSTADTFVRNFTDIVKAVRTNIATTLVVVETTVRNVIQNLRWYGTAPGVADLRNRARGVPAVVVSAGPSLRRNIDLLAQPGVRDKVVIIAVQTTLKPLLERGIKPHFVTALDYHEISRRFYEGLTSSDVAGITLVVEPKCSPAILDTFPGDVRCVGCDIADRILGQGLAREMGSIQPGATVAHLAYYLARHLGSDPVILIGQDLGFTDGQYYAPGAAIHDVWAGELNQFNTLEMLEWQRIARMRSLLRRARDVQGRDIYTDEQMATYLVQFERDFKRDAEQGLTTIDATEGGVRKQHTVIKPLREALASAAREWRPPPAPAARSKEDRIAAMTRRVRELRRQTGRIERLSRDTAHLLNEMIEHHDDTDRVNSLIACAHKNGREVAALDASWLVQFINQTGQLRRFKADRAIEVDENLSPLERQRKQIERDRDNVTWLADAAAYLATLLDDGLPTLAGRPPVSRDPSATDAQVKVGPDSRKRVFACISEHSLTGLGRARSCPPPTAQVLNRLERCKQLDGVLILSDETRSESGAAPIPRHTADPTLFRTGSVASARLFARHCWRGAVADLSVYDEAYHPAALAPVLAELNIDAAAIVGADWTLLDPSLADAVIARYRERPDQHQLTFTQAPPGLAPCVISAGLVAEAAKARGPFSTIGGLLAYIPIAPQADPIAKPVCPAIPAAVRDLLTRCIPDSPHRRHALAPFAGVASAAELASRITGPLDGIEMLEVRPLDLTPAALERIHLLAACDELAITLDGRLATPMEESSAARTLAAIPGVAAVHVRTRLLGGREHAQSLLHCGASIISVDVLADTPDTYAAITGVDAYGVVRDSVEYLLQESPLTPSGLPARWIVPRITRRDAVYAEIESFYNRWLMRAGACIIDPLSAPLGADRIEPLPLPSRVRARMARTQATLMLQEAP